MSCIRWHTRARTVELSGRERHWLTSIVQDHAQRAWALSDRADLERAAHALAMIPETVYGGGLHRLLGEAQAGSHDARWRLFAQLRTALSGSVVNEVPVRVAGIDLRAWDLALNTTAADGDVHAQLAARIDAQNEIHCWVGEEDREWLAGIITSGRRLGVFRLREGWEDVLDLLGDTADAPGEVVMSYSVTRWFPGPFAGMSQAQEFALSADEREERTDAWDQLPAEEQWTSAMAEVKANLPTVQITPESLTEQWYGASAVTIHDLFLPDRDERVRQGAGLEPAIEDAR